MAKKHYLHQFEMAKKIVVPFLEKKIDLNKHSDILEIGSAESGLVDYMTKSGYKCSGMELIQGRIDLAKSISPNISVSQGDITDKKYLRSEKKYDLIIIRDVIEHIPNKSQAFINMHALLKPKGHLYITFPPLYSPYAGHQQCANTWMKYLVWVHLLPKRLISKISQITKESDYHTSQIILNSKIGWTINAFEKMYRKTGFTAVEKGLFILRPVFNIRWKTPIVKAPNIPLLREIYSTGCEYILQKND